MASLLYGQTEASARLWIDVFMYRATAMVDKSKHLFLNLEYTVLNENMSATESSQHTLGSTLDYLVLLVGQDEIGVLLFVLFCFSDIC